MERKHLISFLNQLLANHFVMYVKLHRYTWFMKGDHIFERERFYKTLSNTIKTHIDLLAEHILSIDGKPFATMIKYLKVATIEEATADDEEDEIIEQLTKDLVQINEEIKEIGLKRAEEVNDIITTHILLSFQQKLNMYIWRCKAYNE